MNKRTAFSIVSDLKYIFVQVISTSIKFKKI